MRRHNMPTNELMSWNEMITPPHGAPHEGESQRLLHGNVADRSVLSDDDLCPKDVRHEPHQGLEAHQAAQVGGNVLEERMVDNEVQAGHEILGLGPFHARELPWNQAVVTYLGRARVVRAEPQTFTLPEGAACARFVLLRLGGGELSDGANVAVCHF